MRDEDPEHKGICETCGVPFWDPHNHNPIKTFTVSEAQAYWSREVVRQRNALKPRK